MVALRGRGGIAPTHSWPRHYMGGEWSASRPGRALPPGKDPGTNCTGGWVCPRAGLDTEARGKILCPCRRSNPDRPVVWKGDRLNDEGSKHLRNVRQLLRDNTAHNPRRQPCSGGITIHRTDWQYYLECSKIVRWPHTVRGPRVDIPFNKQNLRWCRSPYSAGPAS
jgi:hypothetical protein